MPTIFTEQVDISEAAVDREAHVLRDVTLIKAGMSLNRRLYSESVLQSAAPLFEGTRAFDSHSRGERRVGDLTGYYTNVRYHEGRLLADRHFTDTQAGKDVWAVVEAIVTKQAPATLAGLSINAVGTAKTRKFADGEGVEVESITAAHSVDDVVSAAAGGTYTPLTAGTGDALAKALIDAMTIEEYTEARPDFIKRLQKEWKTMRDDDAVKAAKAEADQLRTALQEAQDTVTRLTAEREAATVEAQAARRDLALEKALTGVRIPQDWRESLREQLSGAEEGAWAGILERETRKAQVSGYRPRVEIPLNGDVSHEAGLGEGGTPPRLNPMPRDGESIADWQRRITQL